ncbi:5'/3'-nucleotidase SurE [Listeria booriae]|uniref:5'/3'-nucleotidase SurE n=1 Tax=Listeria booriae TaxID=1552123 RepID=UPI001625D979|nr:5'/3'-nucleotidase SurE [Listeria booriae]MBC1512040.1 hypothetical protein [Listeria booriae]MBC6150848.1 hypothetical protein [Listeria booriae]MBC6305086.1 hypothetical protein [Listeria booriae]
MTTILLVNDDGIDLETTKILYHRLNSEGHNSIYVVPESNNSGYSGKLSINAKIKMKRIGMNSFVISGSPVDAVIVGGYLLKKRGAAVDLVISGINCGLNYGNTLMYSGTFMSALEGLNHAPQSIAFSYDGTLDDNSLVYKVVFKVIEELKKIVFENCVVNINFKEHMNCQIKLIEEKDMIDSSFELILPEQIDESTLLFNTNTNANENKDISILSIGVFNRYTGLKLEKKLIRRYNAFFRNMRNFLNTVNKR